MERERAGASPPLGPPSVIWRADGVDAVGRPDSGQTPATRREASAEDDLIGVRLVDRASDKSIWLESVRLVASGVEADVTGTPWAVFQAKDVREAATGEIEMRTSASYGGLILRRSLLAPDREEDGVLTFVGDIHAVIQIDPGPEPYDGGMLYVWPVIDLSLVPDDVLAYELDTEQRLHLAGLSRAMPSLFYSLFDEVLSRYLARTDLSDDQIRAVEPFQAALDSAERSRSVRGTVHLEKYGFTFADRFYVPYDGEVAVRYLPSQSLTAEGHVLTLRRGSVHVLELRPRAAPVVEGVVRDVHGVPIANARVGVIVDRYFGVNAGEGRSTVVAPIRHLAAPEFPADDGRRYLVPPSPMLVQDDGKGEGVNVYLTEITRTDEDGRYKIPLAFTGKTQAYAVVDGYDTAFSAVTETEDPYNSVVGIDLTLEPIDPRDRIRMLVVGTDGDPRPGDWFIPRLAGNPLCRYPKVTPDEEGWVDVSHLVPGATYNIRAEDDWAQVGVTTNSFVVRDGGEIRIDWDEPH